MFVFSWLLTRWRWTLPALVVLLLVGTVGVEKMIITHLSREKATLTARVSKLQSDKEAQDAHDKLEAEVNRLPDADLDKRLSRWLRD
jgi:outer membrane murein-binding lipoprotein Lpp